MEKYDQVFKLNVRSLVQLTNLAVPHLIATKGMLVETNVFYYSPKYVHGLVILKGDQL